MQQHQRREVQDWLNLFEQQKQSGLTAVSSVNYLGRFSGNYSGRLMPTSNYRYSSPFCAGNFLLHSEGLSHDALVDQ